LKKKVAFSETTRLDVLVRLRNYFIRIMVNFSIIQTVNRITDTFYWTNLQITYELNPKKNHFKMSLITYINENYISSLRS
jgi:hypothetical protein